MAFPTTSDVFGSLADHQVPRYFSVAKPDTDADVDTDAATDTEPATNADTDADVFSVSWVAASFSYFCSFLSPKVTPRLATIVEEGLTCMVVLNERPQAQWWILFGPSLADWFCCIEPLPSWNFASTGCLAALDPACFKPHWTTLYALIHGPGNGLVVTQACLGGSVIRPQSPNVPVFHYPTGCPDHTAQNGFCPPRFPTLRSPYSSLPSAALSDTPLVAVWTPSGDAWYLDPEEQEQEKNLVVTSPLNLFP